MLTGFGRGARFALRVHVVERTSFDARVCNQTIISPQNPSGQSFVGGHYIERWISYDPITDFVPESNTLFTSAAPRPGGKQLVFIRIYDICTDATPRWCRTGPQGRVREVLCWGSPRRPGKAARDSKGHSIGLELRLKRSLAHSTVCQCQCQCQ